MMEKTASETGSACSRGSGSDSGDDHASVVEQAQKRRLVIIAAAAAAFVYVLVSRHMSKRQKKKAVRLSRLRVQTNVFDWERHLGEITDGDFRLMHRLTWDACKKLLALLKPMLELMDQTRASNVKYGERVLPATRLAITLRYLAGASIHDPRLLFKTSNSTIYEWIWLTVSTINSHPELQVNFPLPNKVPGKDADADEYNAEQLRRLVELESEFRSNSKTPKADECWHGQVPPCTIIIVHSPAARCGYTHTSVLPRVSVSGGRARWRYLHDEEAPLHADRRASHVNQNAYFVSRKDKFGLLCVAICDYKRRFTCGWDMSHVGNMHDSMAWAATPMGSAINEGALPHPFFINADSAFTVGPSMMVPFWCAKYGSAEDSWNYVQSQNRMAIECAFGMLVRRWGILWRSLEMQWEKCTHVVSACMRLHNWCIDHNTGKDVVTESTGEDVTIA